MRRMFGITVSIAVPDIWMPEIKVVSSFYSGDGQEIRGISTAQIVAAEWERMAPKITRLFERDDTFYAFFDKKKFPLISSRDLRIPLKIDNE